MKTKYWLGVIFILLIMTSIAFSTRYYGSADIGDYSDSAKFFAGHYSASTRSSHSYLFGFIHSPLVSLFKSFFVFKITSILFLILIIFSVYFITNKNKKALLLMLTSPVIWYMAPWINPIQMASLLFLWAFYFIEKYDKKNNLKYLAYSGILIGLGWAIWDTILILAVFLIASFLFEKKFYHFPYLLLFIIIGLSPRLVLDQILFNFPLYTILKSTLGTIANISGGIYAIADGWTPKSFANIFSMLLAIPIMYWLCYDPTFFKNNKKIITFLSLSLVLFLFNPQIRYMLVLVPIMIILIGKKMSKKQFKIQIISSLIILLLFTMPYIIQINHSVDESIQGKEFNYFLDKSFLIELNETFVEDLIREDLRDITARYPNEVFVVGNHPDSYQTLAHAYWGNNIKEFISIQDYEIYLSGNEVIFEKILKPTSNIKNRREIWIGGGMNKRESGIDYSSIRYLITLEDNSNLENFQLIVKYKKLDLWEKI